MMEGDDYEDAKLDEYERRQFILAVERVRKAIADPAGRFAYYADWCETCEHDIFHLEGKKIVHARKCALKTSRELLVRCEDWSERQ